ncbi:putative NAD(P)/FAD-binding protein YdhS [Luteibacter rhizovicinus]|uniref:Putative NAD(P)/FAD-binding protein YdhS n=1 Tax=Luteibacter rhizovicinus TaxID=242606 RepID=A0A4R3YTX7_9GAMM|nr:FAD/NAD(P)-binding protein [Luteibacter rhizovicinus]TCV95892.1 putative NAD(P)/FAD-binding protein YdhS [Luteibacter rhizovicinus]
MFRKVAIIGGGAAAATLVSELLERRTTQPLHLYWYTGDGSGRGIAYGTRSPHHLLNVRAASMGMFASKPQGFLEYAQAADPTVSGSDFLPRRLYGEYLESRVAQAMAKASASGHEVRQIPFTVDSLVPEPSGVTVGYGDESNQTDAAVLAIGSLPPRSLPGVDADVIASGRYITDPWPFLANAEPDERPLRVLVIGLGLTAVDVLLDLSERWPNATFTALSRHGLLPEAHLSAASAPAGDGAELVEALEDDPNIRMWIARLREATEHADDWRVVTDSLRSVTSKLWTLLPDEQRSRFLRHARWAWERARHRMPPQVAESIAAMEKAGRFLRGRGRMQTVKLADDGSLSVTRVKPGGVKETASFDVVVQTVGLNTDTLRTEHPLVRQLVTNGHARPEALGLGFAAQANGALLDGDGKPRPNLFAIGTLLRGALWESTAMPEIRVQARNLADTLLRDQG